MLYSIIIGHEKQILLICLIVCVNKWPAVIIAIEILIYNKIEILIYSNKQAGRPWMWSLIRVYTVCHPSSSLLTYQQVASI